MRTSNLDCNFPNYRKGFPQDRFPKAVISPEAPAAKLRELLSGGLPHAIPEMMSTMVTLVKIGEKLNSRANFRTEVLDDHIREDRAS